MQTSSRKSSDQISFKIILLGSKISFKKNKKKQKKRRFWSWKNKRVTKICKKHIFSEPTNHNRNRIPLKKYPPIKRQISKSSNLGYKRPRKIRFNVKNILLKKPRSVDNI